MAINLSQYNSESQNFSLATNECFNNLASFYDSLYSDINAADDEIGSKLDKLIKTYIKKDPQEIKILDLGSGTGIGLKHLALQGYSITLVDFSNDMLSKAKDFILSKNDSEKLKVNFIESSYNDFYESETNEKYDVIFARGNSLDYIFEEDELEHLKLLIVKHLALNGIFYCSGRDWSKTIQEYGNSFFVNNKINLTCPYIVHYNLFWMSSSILLNKISFVSISEQNAIDVDGFFLPIHPLDYKALISYLIKHNIKLIDQPENLEGIGNEYFQAYLFQRTI